MMKRICLLLLIIYSCAPVEEDPRLDVQGHRGARGLYPENSIPGFIKALEIGVTTLELDLCMTGDGKIIVSHEPYFSPDFCTYPSGNAISKDTLINMYQMTYEEIAQFDCGSIPHPRFPQQQKMRVAKPLLSDVFDEVESYLEIKKLTPVFYNIELKTRRETDTLFHPLPEDFSKEVFELVSKKGLWNRVNIQSFDFRTLQFFREEYPEVRLALLIENRLSWQQNIDSLGFTPEIYSCYYRLLSPSIVKELQDAGMQVIPWTVNEERAIKEVLDWGVNGIISDYPNRVLKIVNQDE
jgi:glycerophosphoryl diester phosphodiesterase